MSEGERDKARGRQQIRRSATPRELVLQEAYKLSRHQVEFTGSNIIDFFVDGEEGIRLSDASEDNWVGFEGGEDRFLFGERRPQVLVRLHVRYPIRPAPLSCQLIFPSSLLGVCPGTQR